MIDPNTPPRPTGRLRILRHPFAHLISIPDTLQQEWQWITADYVVKSEWRAVEVVIGADAIPVQSMTVNGEKKP